MDSDNFKAARTRLDKTQKAMAQLLGVSIKAIHSYEQGWRKIPHHVERQVLFLLSRVLNPDPNGKKCWDINQCPDSRQENCPAWEFNAGNLCWFINGTNCCGKVHQTWADKMESCRVCPVFKQFFEQEKGIINHG